MFTINGFSLIQAEPFFVEGLTPKDKTDLMSLFDQAYSLVASKLEKYVSLGGQPGIRFLQHVQFFNPSKLLLLPEISALDGVPGLLDVPDEQLRLYRSTLGPQALSAAVSTAIDLNMFWLSVQDRVPDLSNVAFKYMYATVHSADVERSFSLYNMILSDRRRRLSESSLRKFAFLYYNKFTNDVL